jgi:hypothetical protein
VIAVPLSTHIPLNKRVPYDNASQAINNLNIIGVREAHLLASILNRHRPLFRDFGTLDIQPNSHNYRSALRSIIAISSAIHILI